MKENKKQKVLHISSSPPPVEVIQSLTEDFPDYYKYQDQIRL